MKKYSKYYKFCLIFAVLSATCAFLAPLASVCAVFTTCTFIFWFAAVMAPEDEKYTEHKRR